MPRRHLFSEPLKKKRLNRTKKLLQAMRSAGEKVYIWSDGKIATVEQQVNVQNDKILAAYSASISLLARTVFRRLKLARVMVCAVVASIGEKTLFVFIKKGVNIDVQAYWKMLEERVLPCVTESFQKRYVFTRDGAPSHTSKATEQWCKTHLRRIWDKNMWPSFGPDFNPMDVVMLSILDSDVCSAAHSSSALLKQAFESAWANLRKNTVRCTCTSEVKRMKAVFIAKSGLVES